MLIDLKLEGKTVIVVGGGGEACQKTQSVIDSGATIWVISKEFSSGIQELAEAKKVALLKAEIKDAKALVGSLNPKPDLLLAVTDDSKLNSELVKAAKPFGCMVYAVDDPVVSDFNLPAIAKVGDVKITVSTSGKSPAMAKVLRERIEKMVTPQDLLEIELQAYIRRVLKEKVPGSKKRAKLIYTILNDNGIKQLLKQGKLPQAQEAAMKLLREKGDVKV